jgi:hypothetical protein
MTNTAFNALLEERILKIRSVLANKADEYATTKDRLHNFKVAARMANTTPEMAWRGMFLKHLVSINDIIECPSYVNTQKIDEKIGDAINYLILLEGILTDRINRDPSSESTLTGDFKPDAN